MMLRLLACLLLLFTAGCAPLGFPAGTLRYVQTERASHGLPPLEWDESLSPAVSTRALNLAVNQQVNHEGIYAVLPTAGVCTRYICELAGNQPLWERSFAVGMAWIGSPPHRACIDDPQYRRVAIAAYVGTDGWVYEVMWLTD